MTTTATRAMSCARCRREFPASPEELATLTACEGCANPVRVTLFPALGKTRADSALPETIVTEGESACFYHPEKRAVTPCDGCGRFLCALCDLDVNGQHLCPTCLESGTKKRRIETLERSRTRWDLIVGNLLLLCVLFFFAAPLIALVTLVIIVWFWQAPQSLVVNSRRRLVVHAVIALLLLAGSGVFWYFAFTG
jgi:uncharacterized integral membrane protein